MQKLLVIDEYPSIRTLLSEELAEEGYEILSLGNPELSFDQIRNFDPDLIIMDPFMGGEMRWDLLRRVKNQKQRLPLLVLTATHRGLPHPVEPDGWVIKSFLFDKLKKNIARILGKQPQHRGPKARVEISCSV